MTLEKPRRSFTTATEGELDELYEALCDAACQWGDEKGFGGLSCAGSFNLYANLRNAIETSANR